MKINIFNNYNKEIDFNYKQITKDLKKVFENKFNTKKDVSLILSTSRQK